MVTTTGSTTTTMIQANSISPTPNPVQASAVDTASSTRRVSDNRRSNKPIMEKRRRARINNCLNELKTLILDAMKKDPARHSKLEKADILEMTVKHLQNLQRQQVAMSAAADPNVINKFRAGFSECATEVGRFPGLDPIVKRRLLQHLANCLNQGSKPQEVPQVQVHILPNTQKSVEQQVPQSSGIILSNGNGTGVQLVPTRLPNGDIALVLPTSAAQQQQPVNMSSAVPLLVPIVPERTASTASATSSSSNYSPSHSPEPMDTMYSQPKPLSLVVRKPVEPMEDKPWRPW
ncbi:protein hairy [Anoplophora glabripennis]|uniref:protein hairy n=1 Tax=Anoplophora glabripennis TaxID=217634 RepID=UPI000874B34D|nr:protein hairy [Anoplophora glabripennis]